MQTIETTTHVVNAPGAPEFITIAQAAQELGVTLWAIVERIEAGRLPAARFGNLTLVSRADIAPADDGGLAAVAVVAKALDVTLDELAGRAGVGGKMNLNGLTSSDLSLLARTAGAMLAAHR